MTNALEKAIENSFLQNLRYRDPFVVNTNPISYYLRLPKGFLPSFSWYKAKQYISSIRETLEEELIFIIPIKLPVLSKSCRSYTAISFALRELLSSDDLQAIQINSSNLIYYGARGILFNNDKVPILVFGWNYDTTDSYNEIKEPVLLINKDIFEDPKNPVNNVIIKKIIPEVCNMTFMKPSFIVHKESDDHFPTIKIIDFSTLILQEHSIIAGMNADRILNYIKREASSIDFDNMIENL